MSENDLEFGQRINWTFIREGTGLVFENLDWYQRTWTCIIGRGLVLLDVDLYYWSWTCIKEETVLVSVNP